MTSKRLQYYQKVQQGNPSSQNLESTLSTEANSPRFGNVRGDAQKWDMILRGMWIIVTKCGTGRGREEANVIFKKRGTISEGFHGLMLNKKIKQTAIIFAVVCKNAYRCVVRESHLAALRASSCPNCSYHLSQSNWWRSSGYKYQELNHNLQVWFINAFN